MAQFFEHSRQNRWCKGRRSPWSFVRILLLILIVSLAPLFSGCARQDTITIGFLGSLTGSLSDLGRAGRNAVILAVEEQNARGGIKGRSLEVLARDTKQNRETAIARMHALADAGVVAVIGPMTTEIALALQDPSRQRGLVLISPTVSGDALTGVDDFFFRVMETNVKEALSLAEHSYDAEGFRRAAVIYDEANEGYAEPFYQKVRDHFETLGGEIILVESYRSGSGTRFSGVVERLVESGVDGIFLITGAHDAARISQQVRLKAPQVPLLSSSWAMTEELIAHGGNAVEGMVFFNRYMPDPSSAEGARFREAYRQRFSEEPSFAATFSYEAARVLISLLEDTRKREEIKPALLARREFPGVLGPIVFDSYGDVLRQLYRIKVRDGAFRIVGFSSDEEKE
ncbi:amino acid/amide ABC transporter substrate-binding protein, HAAT family [Alkalispirochaeta americana]|uniref:Amino acid/amide ABC transporter substrate-binding protein, HAAT family n=1 Tax=Alkalispirochaeta americana TaxID=159291 RepID=A0A1N6T4A3_9SPIO|nr:ABC transporter substrate-binding protein [Alkalispirochaeta americana]SIQ48225.1 amino acid/amide ABC transporter substrate-binding protein, HAAT family [Alkalispirochaeta americana]